MNTVRNRLKRYLLGVGLVSVGLMVCGGGFQHVEATNHTQQQEQEEGTLKADLVEVFELVLKTLYLVLWPLLAIAGASLDNSLVYGEIFYLDRSLWQFWNIMRNFANYALGFILVGSILYYFVKKKAASEILKTIGKLFLAGILINMSWFLTAVLIDISTVMVVNVGAMPLVIVGSETNEEENVLRNVRFLKMHSYFNLDPSDDQRLDYNQHGIVYSCAGNDSEMTKEYYLPCYIENGGLIPKKQNSAQRGYFWEDYKEQFVYSWGEVNQGFLTPNNVSDDYCVYGYDLIENESNAILTPEKLASLKEAGLEKMKEKNNECSTLDHLITKAQGMTGPLFTLYATVLNMGENALSQNTQSLTEVGLTFFIQGVIGLALIVPLFALGVVLVVRAVILWVIIAFSPFLVLLYVFGKGGKVKDTAGMSGDLKNVLGLIFLPVFAVFAISISLLFLTLMSRISLIEGDEKVDPLTLFGAEHVESKKENQKCYNFYSITEICFTESERRTGANVLNVTSWLIVNGFGIALMWTAVFFALRSTKITSKISDGIQTTATTFMKAQQVIPTPWGKMSLGGLERAGKVPNRVLEQKITQDYQEGAVGKMVDKLTGRVESDKDAKTRIDTATSGGTANSSTYKMPSGSSYTDVVGDSGDYTKKIQEAGANQGYDNSKKGAIGFMAANDLNRFDSNLHVGKTGAEGEEEKRKLLDQWEEDYDATTKKVYDSGGTEGTARQKRYRHETEVSKDGKDATKQTYLSKMMRDADGLGKFVHYEFPNQAPKSKEDRDRFTKLTKAMDMNWDTFSKEEHAQEFFKEYINPVDDALDSTSGSVEISVGGETYELTVTTDGDGKKIENITLTASS